MNIARNREILPQHLVVVAIRVEIEPRLLPIDAKAELMRSPKMHCRQVGVRDPLEPVRVAREVDEIVASLAGWEDLKNLVPLRALAGKPAGTGEAQLRQSAVMKINLVLDRSKIQILPPIDGGLDRIE